MPEKNKQPSSGRIAVYAAVTAIAIGGTFWMTWRTFHSTAANSVVQDDNAPRTSSELRDRFQEVYDLGYRVDGTAGNTAVEVVWEFPGLIQRLTEYTARSGRQADTLRVLQDEPDKTLIPILVTLQRNVAIGSDLVWTDLATLTADGKDLDLVRFDPLSYAAGNENEAAGILWFRPKGDDPPDQYQLTLVNIPGNSRASVFTWQDKTLRLYDPTPAIAP